LENEKKMDMMMSMATRGAINEYDSFDEDSVESIKVKL